MFDVEKFYDECNSGKKVDGSSVREYIRSFERVIIWGAAGLGQAIGRLLETWRIKEIIYWDQRYDEICVSNNRIIEKPFSSEYDRMNSLIMYSIPNHVIMKALIKDISAAGYKHFLRGDIFYSGTICPYCLGDIPSSKQCWMKNECRSVICKRLQNIVISHENFNPSDERIDLTYNCFIINSICNLNCTHCVQYINNYPLDKRINIPVENICRDIDLWLELIDSVGTISVMGGETFAHPDIAKIANKFSEHENFGFVSFPTNGLYPIKPEQLDGIDDQRVVIAFGSYQHVATQQQLEIYEKNVELVKSYGISYTESRHLPTWIVPSGLYRFTEDEEVLKQKKQNCSMPPRNLQIRDGLVHTCDRGVALYAMGVADYPCDYFDLRTPGNLINRRQLFKDFVNRSYYETCGHCDKKYGEVPSALQGKIDVFDRGSYVNRLWEQ